MRILAPLSEHFWDSEHAPVCIDDDSSPDQPTITLDILHQTGFHAHTERVISRVPSFLARNLGIPRTLDELCSTTDSYIVPLLKQTSWYTETVDKKTPPTHYYKGYHKQNNKKFL